MPVAYDSSGHSQLRKKKHSPKRTSSIDVHSLETFPTTLGIDIIELDGKVIGLPVMVVVAASTHN